MRGIVQCRRETQSAIADSAEICFVRLSIGQQRDACLVEFPFLERLDESCRHWSDGHEHEDRLRLKITHALKVASEVARSQRDFDLARKRSSQLGQSLSERVDRILTGSIVSSDNCRLL